MLVLEIQSKPFGRAASVLLYFLFYFIDSLEICGFHIMHLNPIHLPVPPLYPPFCPCNFSPKIKFKREKNNLIVEAVV